MEQFKSQTPAVKVMLPLFTNTVVKYPAVVTDAITLYPNCPTVGATNVVGKTNAVVIDGFDITGLDKTPDVIIGVLITGDVNILFVSV